MDKKCIILFNQIINGNKHNRDMCWNKNEILNDDKQPYLCCEKMEKTFYEFDYYDYDKFGICYSYGDDQFHEGFKFCPFCGAPIEYKLNKRQRYINQSEPKWVLIDIE